MLDTILTQTRREDIWYALLEVLCENDYEHECLADIPLKQLKEIFFNEALLFYGPPPMFSIRTSRDCKTLLDFRNYYARETVITYLREQMYRREKSPAVKLRQSVQSLFYRLVFKHEWKEVADKISRYS
jgi:hypothetical protein